jgi:NitT/TauT family transport system substrate-binding protein
LARGEVDFGTMFVPGAVRRLDADVPIRVLAGLHSGCFDLLGHENVRTFTDLKGKQVAINEAPGSADHLFVSIMAAHVGLDPKKDFRWITTDDVAHPIDLFVQGKVDAYLAFVLEFPELRARNMGHVVVDMAVDRPWSEYFCCVLVANADFVRQYPIATNAQCARS